VVAAAPIRTSDRKREWSGRRARARLGIARRDALAVTQLFEQAGLDGLFEPSGSAPGTSRVTVGSWWSSGLAMRRTFLSLVRL
jgi:hypothetical protein